MIKKIRVEAYTARSIKACIIHKDINVYHHASINAYKTKIIKAGIDINV